MGEPTRLCLLGTSLSIVHAVGEAAVRSGWCDLGQVNSLNLFSYLHQLVDI